MQKFKASQLAIYQDMPLECKINLSYQRIRQFYEKYEGNVYIAFSGGKDSTVMLDLIRRQYPHVPATFCNTGLEYPEILKFINR